MIFRLEQKPLILHPFGQQEFDQQRRQDRNWRGGQWQQRGRGGGDHGRQRRDDRPYSGQNERGNFDRRRHPNDNNRWSNGRDQEKRPRY